MVVMGNGSRMLMAVAAATLLVLPTIIAGESHGSNEEQGGGLWAGRAAGKYWELHGLAGRDPDRTGDDWSPPPWFVDVSQDDDLTKCSDIRSNLKVPPPRSLLCLTCKNFFVYFFGHGWHTRGHAPWEGPTVSPSEHPINRLSTWDKSSCEYCQTIIQCALSQDMFVNTLFFAPKVVVELGVRFGCSSFVFEGTAR